MTWEAINGVSQLVSSIAVVVSLLYLALQVHRSTRVAKIAAQDSAATALRDVTKPFMEDAEVSRIWGTGLVNLQQLSPEDQARFFHAAYQFLKAFETIHFHYVNGLLDRELWNGWHELLRHYIASPGLGEYWAKRKTVFSGRFAEFVDHLPKPTNQFTVGSLVAEQ